MIILPKNGLLFFCLYLFLGIQVSAQTMSEDDIKEAEGQGMTRYRVSGTYTEKVSASVLSSSDMMNLHMIVSKSKMSLNGSKTLTFNGIGFMSPVNNDSPDLCKYEMQIDGQVSSWISCNTSGSVSYGGSREETITYSQPGQGSCTSQSSSTSNLISEGIENYVGVNFCFFSPSKWMIEVGTTFKNAKMITKGEEQRCEQGKVIKLPRDSETEYFTRIGFDTSLEKGGKISFDGKKFIITHSFSRTEKTSYHATEGGDIPYDLITSGIATVELTPISTDIEAFIEPVVGVQSFKEEWLPEGIDVENNTKIGNQAKFRVYLRDPKKPNQNLNSKIKEVRYSLDKVSHEPGFAMNFPTENPSIKADLQIGSPNDEPNPAIENLSQIITKAQDVDFNVMLTSFDYGAYGLLKATVVLDDGKILNAKDPLSDRTFMPIPYRVDIESRIADQWKKQQQTADLADNDDEEKGEDGIGDHNGDGFAHYEEYRGFIENKKHIRLNPTKKDLLICNQIVNKERSGDGIAMYQSVTKIVPHTQFRPEEFGKEELSAADFAIFSQYHIKPFKYNKILNFNSSPQTHLVNQHGMLLMPTASSLGAAFAIQSAGNLGFSTLKNWLCLVIPADFDPSPKGYSTTRGEISKDGKAVKYNPDGKAVIITDFYASRVAHEMLHYSNVKHHGNTDLWYGRYYSNGNVIIFQETTKDGAGVDKDNNGKADTVIVKLKFDNGKEIYPNDKRWYAGGAWENGLNAGFVSKEGGQHSGNDDCIMRYDVAGIYEKITTTGVEHYFAWAASPVEKPSTPSAPSTAEKPPLKPYIEEDPRPLFNQLAGIHLCDSATGTGVNGTGFEPRPRNGNATVGNCKHQVCINDRYH